MTKPLSPAAQAVLDAFTEDNSLHDWKHNHYNTEALAAALRAAADQVVPDLPKPTDEGTRQADTNIDYWEDCQQHRANLLAIAYELEAH